MIISSYPGYTIFTIHISTIGTDTEKETCYSVKLGYNDHGFNEFTAVKKRNVSIFGPIWWFCYINAHGYNELTAITNKCGQSRDVRVWLILFYDILLLFWRRKI